MHKHFNLNYSEHLNLNVSFRQNGIVNPLTGIKFLITFEPYTSDELLLKKEGLL
jgi:hypothetical protein